MLRRGLAVLAVPAVLACGRVGYRDEGTPGLAGDGVRLSEPGALVPEEGRYDVAPALGGQGYVVAWAEYPPADRTPTLYVTLVSQDGEILIERRALEVLSTAPQYVHVATGEDGYVVFLRVASGDLVTFALDDALATVMRDDTANVGGTYTASAVPGGFLATYHTQGAIWVQPLDALGVPRGPQVQFDPGNVDAEHVSAVWTGSELALTWTDRRSGARRIWFARLDAGGAPLAPSIALYDAGDPQGNSIVTRDGTGGLLVGWDGSSTFPEHIMRTDALGTPLWSSPARMFTSYNWYHRTLAAAASPDGRLAIAWINETPPLLGNVEYALLDGSAPDAPDEPSPQAVGDAAFGFCYPEMARASRSFGTAFVGEVEGSVSLFLALLPD
jgi:hypothetical protein